MDTTIEREFFKAYEYGGVVSDCVLFLLDDYELYSPDEHNNDTATDEASVMWKTEREKIVAKTKRFRDVGFWCGGNRLKLVVSEVEENLREVEKDERRRDDYLMSLLRPFCWISRFGDGEGIAWSFTLTMEMNRLDKKIKALEDDWRARMLACEGKTTTAILNRFLPLSPVLYKKSLDEIKQCEQLKQWHLRRSDFLKNIVDDILPQWGLERCLILYYESYKEFANQLDAILLRFGFDLMEFQKVSGCFLIDDRNFDELVDILGSEAVVEYYINRLHKPQQKEEGFRLPRSLDVGNARKYIERAIEKGYMEQKGNGCRWLRTKAQLGYFCSRAYTQPRPLNAIEVFFGVKKISSSITQADYEATRIDVKTWRKEIDDTLFYD